MFILKKVYLGIILSVVVLVICEDEKAAEEEEKDPWDTSTDKYRHHLGNSKSSDSEEPVKIDVTEVSESEVHSSRSKLCKNCKRRALVRETPKTDNSTKLHNSSLASRNIRKEVDEETKEQIKDAIDEQDPADSETKKTKAHANHHGGVKKHGLSKKQLNNKIDFYPGSLWEYPYPYYHPQYGCGGKKGPCTPEAKPIEAKEDKTKKDKNANAHARDALPKLKVTGKKTVSKEKDAKAVAALPIRHDKKKEKVSGRVFPKIKGFGWIWKGPRVSEIGTSWGTPCWFNKEKKQFTCRQLVPSHYYGPPSAGWGGFQPGQTGGGWGTPYWYKKCAVPQIDCKQIIPSHYYGPPSAGWGGFKPGHTGGGWGTPYWYRKCLIPQKQCRQLIPVHYYGPPSAGWGGFQPGQTGAGWGAPHWNKRCETPQLNCRGYIPSPYQSNWLAPGSSSLRSSDPWSQSLYGSPMKNDQPSRKWNVLSDYQGVGHIEKENGGWDSGLGAGHGLSSWGEANQFGSFPESTHEECNKMNQGIKQGYCDESVGSCEKMHDYLPDQHDPVDEEHCGVHQNLLYNDNVGQVEYEKNGILQISKGHEDETIVDIDGTKHAGEWSGKKKNDIAKKRLTSHALRIMKKRKRRRKLLRGKARNGHRRTKIFKHHGKAGSKTLKATNQTSAMTKSTIHSSTKRKKHEEKSKKKYEISSGTDTGMFDPLANNLGRGYGRFTDSQLRSQAPVERIQDMQTCGRRFPLEYCAWHAPHNLVSEGWGGHGWVGPYPNEMHMHDHHDADPSGYGAMAAVGHEMKVGEVTHLAHGPETIRFHNTLVAPRPGTEVDLGNGYHDGDRGFHNEMINVGEKTMERHMNYPNQQFSYQFNGNSYGGTPAFQAIPEGMRTAHPVFTNTMTNPQAGSRVMMTASHDSLANVGPYQQAVSGNMMPEPQGVSYTRATNQQVVSDNMMTNPHVVSGNIKSGPSSIHDTVMAGAHEVSKHLMNYENNDHHVNGHEQLQMHTPLHAAEPLPLPRGHVDINDVHHVGTVGYPVHDRYSNDVVHHVPIVHRMQSYPEYPENGQYFGNYRGPVFTPNNPPGSVVISNPHEEPPIANTQSEGPVFPYRNDEVTMITHDGLRMNNPPDEAQTNEFPEQMSISDPQPGNMMRNTGPFQGQLPSFNEYEQPVQETNVESNMQHFIPNSEGDYEPNLRHNFNTPSEENYEPNQMQHFNHPSEQNYEPNQMQHFNPPSEQNYNGHLEASQQEHLFIGPHSDHVPMHTHSASVRDNTLVEGHETDEFAKRTKKNTSLPMKREKQVPVTKRRSRKKVVKLIQIENMIPIKTVPVHVTKFSVSKPASKARKENEGNRRTKRSLSLHENHLSKSKSNIHRKNSGKKWTIASGDGQDRSSTYVDGFHAPQEYQWGDTGNYNDFDDDHMGGDNRMEACRLKHSVEYCAFQANRELGGLRHDEDFGGHGWIGNYAKVHEHEPEHVHTETHTDYSYLNTPTAEVRVGELQHVTASVPEHHELPNANIEVGEVHHLLTDSPEQHHHLEGTTASPNEHINVDEVNSVESVEHLPYLQHSLHHSNVGQYNHEGNHHVFHNDHGDTGSYTNADNHEGDHLPFHDEHNDMGSDLHGEHFGENNFYPHHDYDYFGSEHHVSRHNEHNDGEVGISHDTYEPSRGPKIETSEANHLEAAPDVPVAHDNHPNDDLSHVFVDTGVGSVPLADHPASVIEDGSIQDDTERDEFAKRTGNATRYKKHQKVIVHPGRNSNNTVTTISSPLNPTNSTIATVSAIKPDTNEAEVKTTKFLTSRRHVLATHKIHKRRQSEKRNLTSNSVGKAKT